MRIEFDFSRGTAAFPTAAAERMSRASDTALRLLILLASERECREDFEGRADYMAERLRCSRKELDMALGFWCGAGVMDVAHESGGDAAAVEPLKEAAEPPVAGGTGEGGECDSPAAAGKEAPAKKKSAKLMRAAGVPEYTSEELADLLEDDRGATGFIDEAQRRIKRMLNPREVSILIGLRGYLELEDEYIFVLLDYCARIGKTSLRYVETVAFGMYDDGVTDPDALAAALAGREAYGEFEGKFKVMIGARGRRLTAKESRFLGRWSGEMKYDFRMVELAYEITVDSIHEYSPAYMNTILERWYSVGITTPEMVEAERAKKKQSAEPGKSYDIDEFIEAALRRSQGETDT